MSTPINRRSHRRELERQRKVQSLFANLCGAEVPRQWVLDTGKLLITLHDGSYAVRNQQRLSARYLKWLATKRSQTHAALAGSTRNGSTPEQNKKLHGLPLYSQAKAFGVQLVFAVCYEALANGLPIVLAQRVARAMYLLIFNKAISEKHLARIIARVEARGGPLAPIEAYADGKSIPHYYRKGALK